MKRLGLIVAALVLAGCCDRGGEEPYGPFVPKTAAEPSQPEVFAEYGPAMAHQDGYAMAYEWQRQNSKAVEVATTPEVLKALVATGESADALLAQIGTSYDGDPVALTQIAAVTQIVMCRKWDGAKAARKIWVAALQRRIAGTDDGYVKTFCRQQLRLCEFK